jgi:hypothetical protein
VHRKLLGHIVNQLLRLGVTDNQRDDTLAQVRDGRGIALNADLHAN